ncbi:uncharacterized protein B0P05DRAFT_476655, partial [Gilbertella persicaria]|uniref:uncharacterized protein n=1 Tax=Gilbertella persicaria TaxID=101096 RepID=UPI00221F56D6
MNPVATVATAVSTNKPTEIQTRIWRHSLAPNAYFLDISKISHLTDAQHFDQILKTSFSPDDFYGIKALGSRNNGRYIEINPVPEIEKQFCQNGI